MSNYIGVDLGGTKILTAVAGSDGEITAREKQPTEASKGTDTVMDNVEDTINKVMEKAELQKADIKNIGVGSPGPLNTKEGIIYESANFPWENVPFVKLLEEKTGLPVKLENDANAAALGETLFGAGRDVDHLIYITISTGIGSGIIINRKIYHGMNDGAGEAGHMIIEPDGPLCGCGKYGCLEALASGTAIGRMGQAVVNLGHSQIMEQLSNGNLNKIDAHLVARAAYKGDKYARNIYKKAGYYLGIGFANLVSLFNPEMLVLGGGVMKAEELFMDSMRTSLEERAIPSSLKNMKICRAELGSDTGVKGAVAVAMRE